MIKNIKTVFIVSVFILLIFLNTSCLQNQEDKKRNAEEFEETVTGAVESAEIYPEQPVEVSEEDFKSLDDFEDITLEISYVIRASGDTKKIEFTSTLPADYEHRQQILDYSFSIEPSEIYSAGENTYAK